MTSLCNVKEEKTKGQEKRQWRIGAEAAGKIDVQRHECKRKRRQSCGFESPQRTGKREYQGHFANRACQGP